MESVISVVRIQDLDTDNAITVVEVDVDPLVDLHRSSDRGIGIGNEKDVEGIGLIVVGVDH